MKSILAVAVLTATSVVFGQPLGKRNKQNGTVEPALVQIEQEMDYAVVRGDTSPSERYLADNSIFTGPDGMVTDKARNIADLKSGDLKLESSKLDDMKVQVHGNTAVVTYGTTDKGTYKGKDISGKYRWTDVFVKHNSKWQIVAGQGTRVAQQ